MFDHFYKPKSTQYFQIAFLDEGPAVKRFSSFSKKRPISSLLKLHKKKILFLKKKKLKLKHNLFFKLKNRFFYFTKFLFKTAPYYILNLNKNIIKSNKSFNRISKMIRLKLKKKKSKKSNQLVYTVIRNKSRNLRKTFLRCWYNFYIDFFSKSVFDNINLSENTSSIKEISSIKFYLNLFKKKLNCYFQWLGIDLDNVEPQTELCLGFYFNQMSYYFFKRKIFFKKLFWLDNFKFFFFKNNNITKVLTSDSLLFLNRTKIQPVNIYIYKLNTHKILFSKKFVFRYYSLFEKIFYKIQYSFKNEISFYRFFLIKKWYLTKRIKTFFYKTNFLINTSSKDRLFVRRVDNFCYLEPKAYPLNVCYSDVYNIVIEELLKHNYYFDYYYNKINMLKINIKKTIHFDIDYESNFFSKSHLIGFDYINAFNKKPSSNVYNLYYYGFLNVLDYKKSNFIKYSNNFILKNFIKLFQFNNKYILKDKKVNIENKQLNIFYFNKGKILNIYKFLTKYKDHNNGLFFNKFFEKYFLFIYFTPFWSITNDIRYKSFKSLTNKFLTNLPIDKNLYKSNIYINTYENLLGFNMVKFVRKHTPVVKMSRAIELHLINFLENFMQKNVCVHTMVNLNIKYILQYNFIENMYRKLYSMQLFFGKNFFLKEMLEIFLWFFKFKDLSLFENWFLKAMSKLQPKKHRKFLLFLKSCICGYFIPFFGTSGLKGFFMRISGKISVTGNAKTRSQYIKWGVFGTSKKDNKLELAQNIVRTNTGALGVTIMISY